MAKKKRGNFKIGKFAMFFLAFAILLSSFIILSEKALALTPGICLSDLIVPNKMCMPVNDIAECCGSNSAVSGYAYCNSSFIPTSNAAAEIINLEECKVYENSCCSNVTVSNSVDCQLKTRKAECDQVGGKFNKGFTCSAVSECEVGCCIWNYTAASYTDNTCKYMAQVGCNNWDTYDSSLAGYKFNSFDKTISSTNCNTPSYCDNIFTSNPPGNISGIVTDNSTPPIPLAGAIVSSSSDGLTGFIATTDATGLYNLANLPPGEINLYTIKTGYVQQSTKVMVFSNVKSNLPWSLQPTSAPRAAISVQVFDELGSKASGVNVELLDVMTKVTDANGMVDFPSVLLQNQTLKVSKENYFAEQKQISPSGSIFQIVTFNLKRADRFNISGRVVDFSEVGIPARIVILDTTETVTTDTQGKFTIENVPLGDHSIRVKINPANETTSVFSVNVAGNVINQVIYLNPIASQTCAQAFTSEKAFCNRATQKCTGSGGPPNNQPTTDSLALGPEFICCNGVTSCTAVTNPADDYDGDGVPNNLDNCPWEPALVNPQYATELSHCSDGIDNDCDSTGRGMGNVNTNSEDKLSSIISQGVSNPLDGINLVDSDCRICPTNMCDYAGNKICYETNQTSPTSIVWQSYTLPAENITYCNLCSADPDCRSECEKNGKSCCPAGQGAGNSYASLSCNNGKECADSCTVAPTYICCQNNWACDGNSVSDAATCGVNAYRCQGTYCQAPPSCKLYEPFNSTNNTNPTYTRLIGPSNTENTQCTCNGLTYNTDKNSAGATKGFCCPTGISSAYCPPPVKRNLTIELYDKVDGTPILPNKKVIAYYTKNPWVRTEFVSPGTDIERTFGIPFLIGDSVEIVVEAQGYEFNKSGKIITDTPNPNILKFILKDKPDCSDNHISVTSLRTHNVAGKKQVRLTWNSTCKDIDSYEIRRVKVSGSSEPEVLVAQVLFTQKSKTEFEYLDDSSDLQWDTIYQYSIIATYKDGFSSQVYTNSNLPESNSNEGNTRIYTGDQRCEGHLLFQEFCLSSNLKEENPYVLGVSCGYNNTITKTILDCSVLTTPSFCYVTSNNRAQCRAQQPCFDFASEPEKVFGLYYDKVTCTQNKERMCYFDYSNTSVDICTNCTTGLKCFDYRSQSACEQDNCQLGKTTPPFTASSTCQWYDYPELSEFGKGLCFKANYTKNDTCYKCNASTNTPFDNPECTQNVCARLGACFSSPNNISCEMCNQNTICESFKDEMACVGGVNGVDRVANKVSFSINATNGCGSSDKFIRSNDACAVGVCKWGMTPGATNPSCFKDANDDGNSDCYLGNGNWNGDCLKDKTAPVTTLKDRPQCVGPNEIIKNCINKNSIQKLNFTIVESQTTASNFGYNDGNGTKYCITPIDPYTDPSTVPKENSSSGCPMSNFDENSDSFTSFKTKKTLVLPNHYVEVVLKKSMEKIEEIPQGNMKLRFYSTDLNHNVEEIKTEPLFIDTIPPKIIDFNFTAEEVDKNWHSSNLTIYITTDSPSVCDEDRLDPIAGRMLGTITPSRTIGITKGNLSKFFTTNYTNITDGVYSYFVNCTDKYGNKNQYEYSIRVNSLNYILGQWPDDKLGDNKSDPQRLNNIFNTSSVTLKIKTGRNLECSYSPDLKQSWQPFTTIINGNGSIGETVVGDYTNHSVTLSNLPDGNYEYPVKCYPTGALSPISETTLKFSVDTMPPQSLFQKWSTSLGDWENVTSSALIWYKPDDLKTLRLIAIDSVFSSPIESLPGNAGWNHTLWCINATSKTGLTAACIPSNVLKYDATLPSTFAITNSTYVCMDSVDRKGNKESKLSSPAGSPKCVYVQIDNSSPSIRIDLPKNNTVTNNSEIKNILVDISDLGSADIKQVFITVSNELFTDQFVSVGSIASKSGSIYTIPSSSLYPGKNYLQAHAVDSANNIGDSKFIVVYSDKEGPDFAAVNITNSTNASAIGIGAKAMEFGKDIIFDVKLNDTKYTLFDSLGQNNSVYIAFTFPDGNMFFPAEKMQTISDNKFRFIFQFNSTLDAIGIPQSVKESAGIGDWNVTFTAYDKFGNNKTSKYSFKVVDASSPVFIAEIKDVDGNVSKAVLWGKQYVLHVNSSEKLKTLPSAKLTINGITTNVFQLTPIKDNYFTSAFTIDTIDLLYNGGIEKNGTVEILLAFDMNDNPGISTPIKGDKFYFDSKSPLKPVYRYPNGEKIYYSNSKAMTLTGYEGSNLSNINISLLVSKSNDTITKDNWVLVQSTLSHIASPALWNSTVDLTSYARNPINQIVLVGYHPILSSNTAFHLAFENDNLNLPEGQYYQVTNIQTLNPPFGPTIFNVSPNLRNATIASKERVFIYNGTAQIGWFKIDILNLDSGNNYVILRSQDEYGNFEWNPLSLSKTKLIVYDSTPPYFKDYSPQQYKTINNNKTQINVTISDINPLTGASASVGQSNLDPTSIKMFFNDTWHTCTPSVLYTKGCRIFCNDDSSQCNASFDFLSAIPKKDTPYIVKVYAKDKAQNENITEWTIGFDSTVPDYPSYFVEPSLSSEFDTSSSSQKWYTSSLAPKINVSYPLSTSSNFTTVKIIYAALSKNNEPSSAIAYSSMINSEGNDFAFILPQSTPAVSTDGEYKFEITAGKVLGVGSIGTPLTDSITIIIDNSPPVSTPLQVKNFSNGTVLERGKKLFFSSNISDASPNVTVKLKVDGILYNTVSIEEEPTNKQVIFEITPVLNPISYTYDQFEAGNHTAALELTDVFGHTSTFLAQFIITDTQASPVQLTQISPGRAINSTQGVAKVAYPLSSSNRLDIYFNSTDELQICNITSAGKSIIIENSPRFNHIASFIDNSMHFYPAEAVPKTYTVSCIDSMGNIKSTNFTIVNDLTAPTIDTISPTNNGVIKLIINGKIVDLSIATNELAYCKYYGNLTTSAKSFASTLSSDEFYSKYMMPFNLAFTPNDTSAFNTTSSVNIDNLLWELGTENKSYTYYVACEDLAGNLMSKANFTTFTVDVTVLRILSMYPTEIYGGNTSVELKVQTDKSSTCTYYAGAYGSGLFTKSSDGKTHTAFVSGLAHGENRTYTVSCQALLGELYVLASSQFSFIVDLDVTPSPAIYNITNSSYGLISRLPQSTPVIVSGISGKTHDSYININGIAENNSTISILVDNVIKSTLNPSAEIFSLPLSLASYSDEEHKIRISAKDRFGNYKLSDEISLTLDRIRPAKPIVTPIPSMLLERNLDVYGTVDEAGIKVVAYNNITQILETISSSGANCVFADAISNATLGSKTITLNSTSPSINAGDWIEFQNYPKSTLQRYKVESINTPLFALPTLTLTEPVQSNFLNSKVMKCTTENPNGWFKLSLFLNPGYNEIRILGIDGAGNLGIPTDAYKTIVDLYGPTVNFVYPNQNEIMSETRPKISAIVEDIGTGIDLTTILLSIDTSPYYYQPSLFTYSNSTGQLIFTLPQSTELSEGQHTAVLTVYDHVSRNATASLNFEVNRNVPQEPTLKVNNNVYDRLLGTLSLNTNSLNLNFEFNSSDTINITSLKFDNIAISFVNVSSYTFTSSVSTADSSNHLLEIKAKKWLSAPGEVSNYGPQRTIKYIILTDTTAPIVRKTSFQKTVELGNDATVKVFANDTTSAVEKVIAVIDSIIYTMDKLADGIFSTLVRKPTLGSHNIQFNATDILANVNDSITDTFSVVDTTPPKITPLNPSNGDFVSNDRTSIKILLEDASGISSYKLFIFGTQVQSGLSFNATDNTLTYNFASAFQESQTWFSQWLNNPSAEVGTFNLAVEAKDTGGQTSNLAWTFTIDKRIAQTPKVEFAETEGDNTGKTFKLLPDGSSFNLARPDISVVFYSSVKDVTAQLFKGDIGQNAQQLDPYYSSLDNKTYGYKLMPYTLLAEGTYNLKITATNPLNGISGNYIYPFVVDKTPPSFTISNPKSAKDEQVTLSIIASEVLISNPDVTLIDSSGKSFKASFVSVLGFSYIYTISITGTVAEGDAKIIISAKDKAENIGASNSTITIDRTPPIITTLEPKSQSSSPTQLFTSLDSIILIAKTNEEATCTISVGTSNPLTRNLIATADKLTHKDTAQIDTSSGAVSLTISCTDMLGNFVSNTFTLNKDVTKPIINAFTASKSSPITDYPETDLIITASEPVICKYSNETTDYTAMQFTFPTSAKRNFTSSLSTNSIDNPQLYNLGEKASYTFHASCEDRAGNIADFKSTSFEVDIQPGLSLKNMEPSGIIPFNSPINLAVDTNHKAYCYYTYANSQGIVSETLFAKTNGLHHKATLPTLIDDNYNYTVRCTYTSITSQVFTNTSSSKFTVDTLPPKAPIISSSTHQQDTWSKQNSSSLSWIPAFDLSSVKEYQYSLTTTDCNKIELGNLTTITSSSILLSDLESKEQLFCLRTIDEYKRAGAFASYKLKVDRTLPVSSSIDLLAGNWHSSQFTQDIVATDALSGISSISYRVNGGNLITVSKEIVSIPITQENQTTITFYSQDKAGNVEQYQKSVQLKLDTLPPTAPQISSATHIHNQISNVPLLKLSWQSTDELSGISKYNYEIYKNGILFRSGETALPSMDIDMIGSFEKYDFRVRAADNAKNIGAWSNNFTVIFDSYVPQIEFVNDLPLYTNTSDISVSGIVYGASNISVILENGIFKSTEYKGTLLSSQVPLSTITLNDYKAGDQKILVRGDYRDESYIYLEFISHKAEYKIVSRVYTPSSFGTPAFTELTLSSPLKAALFAGTKVNLYTSRVYGAFDINSIPLRAGINTLTLTALDNAGNIAVKKLTNVIYDTQSPVILLDSSFSTVSPGDITNGNNTQVKFYFSDIGLSGFETSGIKIYYDAKPTQPSELSVNGFSSNYVVFYPNGIANTSSLSEGSHTILLEVKDRAGNLASYSLPFTVVNELPLATISLSNEKAGFTNISNPNLNVVFSTLVIFDNLTLDNTILLPTSQNGTHFKFNITALTEGKHTLTAIAHTTSSSSKQIKASKIFTVDTFAPYVAFVNSNYKTNKQLEKVYFNYTESNLDVAVLGINYIPYVSYHSSGSYNFLNYEIYLTEGQNTVQFAASDRAGHISFTELNITLDTIPPSQPIILSPKNNFITNSTLVSTTGIAKGASYVTLHSNSRIYNLTSISANGDFSATVAISQDTSTELYADSFDDIGNKISSSKITVLHDSISPILTDENPLSGATLSQSMPILSAFASDYNSGLDASSSKIKIAKANYPNQATQSNAVFSGDKTSALLSRYYSEALTQSEEDVAEIYETTVTISDIASNFGKKTWQFRYDPKAPLVVAITPTQDAYLQETSPQITVTFDKSIKDISLRLKDDNAQYELTPTRNTLNQTFGFNSPSTPLLGTVYMYITATGTDGRPVSYISRFYIDSDVPVINITNTPLITNLYSVDIKGTFKEKTPDKIELISPEYQKISFNTGDNLETTFLFRNIPLSLDSSNTLIVKITDKSGRTSISTVTVKQDSTPPKLSVDVTPLSNSNISAIPAVQFTGTTDGQTIKVYVNEIFNKEIKILNSNFADSIVLGKDNLYFIKFVAEDAAKNEFEITKLAVVDSSVVPPVIVVIDYPFVNTTNSNLGITLFTPTSKSLTTSVNTLNLTGMISFVPSNSYDTLNNTKITVKINNLEQASLYTAEDGIFLFVNLPLQQGSNIITLNAKSMSGAIGNESLVIFLDTKAPQISIINPKTIPGTYDSIIEPSEKVRFDIVTDKQTSCKLYLAKSTEAITQGTLLSSSSLVKTQHVLEKTMYLEDKNNYQFNISCTDAFGNVNSIISTWYVDSDAPLVTKAQITPNPIVVPSEPLAVLSVETDKLSQCKYIDALLATEPINSSANKALAFDIGTSLDASSGIYSTKHSKVLTISDFPRAQNGEYNFYVVCKNPSGLLTANVGVINFNVNIDWPLVILKNGPSGSINKKSTELFVTTNLNSTCIYSEGTSTWLPLSIRKFLGFSQQMSGNFNHSEVLSNLSEGQHTYRIECTAIDNPSKKSPITQISFLIDTQADKPIIYSPTQNMPFSDQIIMISGKVEKNSTVQIYLDGLLRYISHVPDTEFSNLPLSFATFTTGKHTIRVDATDSAGNTNSQSIDVIYTTSPPIIVSTSPAEGTINGLNILSISAKIQGDFAIPINFSLSTIKLYNSTGLIPNIGTLSTENSDTLKLTLASKYSPLEQGDYVMEIVAYDVLGRSVVKTVPFSVNTNSPKITLLTPVQDGKPINIKKINITGTISSSSPITSANFSLNNEIPLDILVIPNTGIITFNVTRNLTEGINQLRIMANGQLSAYPALLDYNITLRTTGPVGIVTIED